MPSPRCPLPKAQCAPPWSIVPITLCSVTLGTIDREAYRRGSLPPHHLVSDSANPHFVSGPLTRPLWDHRSTHP